MAHEVGHAVVPEAILFDSLIDDAALFPPSSSSMEDTVARHRAARIGPCASLLGRFLCPASRLPEYLGVAGADDGFALGVILSAPGSGWVEEVRSQLEGIGELGLAGRATALELRPPGDAHLGELRTLARMIAEVVGPGAPVTYLEVAPGPRSEELLGALGDAAAEGARLGAKIRCGGERAELFPSVETVRLFIEGACSAGVPFKATAGLHHPFRVPDEGIGVIHHGFLNLLVAAALWPEPIADAIAEEDPSAFAFDGECLRWRDEALGAEALRRARLRFVGLGSCGFEESASELERAGLLAAPQAPA